MELKRKEGGTTKEGRNVHSLPVKKMKSETTSTLTLVKRTYRGNTGRSKLDVQRDLKGE